MMLLTPAEEEAMVSVARGAARRWRVPEPDVRQGLWEWVLRHRVEMRRWRDEERGMAKLVLSLRREANRLSAVDRGYRPRAARPPRKDRWTDGPVDAATVARALPYVWSVESWPQPGAVEHPMSGRVVRADDGRALDAWALLADISTEVAALPNRDRMVLHRLTALDEPASVVAEQIGASVAVVHQIKHRAIARIAARLG